MAVNDNGRSALSDPAAASKLRLSFQTARQDRWLVFTPAVDLGELCIDP
jgi:hypothetical protein